MAKQEAKAAVPRLRFPEFREEAEWTQAPLGTVFHRITNGKANAQDHEEGGRYPLFDRSEVVKASSSFAFSAEAVILPGEGMAFRPRYFEGKFNLHQRAYALMECQGDAKYFYHALDYAKGDLALKAVKSTVLSLRLPIIENFALYAPEKREQQKIADCLTSLDEVIAAQDRKVEALKAHKRGLMQQLFPREGETRPRLRFPEFRDAPEWEEKTLRSVCERIMDGTHFSPKSKSGPRPYLTSKNIREGHLDLSKLSYVSEDEHREIYAKCPVRKFDVLLTKDGANTGNCAINTLDYEFSLLSSVAVLRGESSRIAQEFLYQLLASERMQSTIINSMSGQAITRITLEKLGSYTIPLASLPEQQRIADCLSTLDTQITAETDQLAAFKTHKQGLMQQLFPLAEVAA